MIHYNDQLYAFGGQVKVSVRTFPLSADSTGQRIRHYSDLFQDMNSSLQNSTDLYNQADGSYSYVVNKITSRGLYGAGKRRSMERTNQCWDLIPRNKVKESHIKIDDMPYREQIDKSVYLPM